MDSKRMVKLAKFECDSCLNAILIPAYKKEPKKCPRCGEKMRPAGIIESMYDFGEVRKYEIFLPEKLFDDFAEYCYPQSVNDRLVDLMILEMERSITEQSKPKRTKKIEPRKEDYEETIPIKEKPRIFITAVAEDTTPRGKRLNEAKKELVKYLADGRRVPKWHVHEIVMRVLPHLRPQTAKEYADILIKQPEFETDFYDIWLKKHLVEKLKPYVEQQKENGYVPPEEEDYIEKLLDAKPKEGDSDGN